MTSPASLRTRLRRIAPWAALLVFALILSGCAMVTSAVGAVWPTLVLATAVALAACGSGGGGGGSGSSGPTKTVVQLGELDGTDGFRVDGLNGYDEIGRAVSAVGDLNGDGIPDIVVAAPGFDGPGPVLGAVYVIFGHSSGAAWSSSVSLSTLNGSNGFRIDAASGGDFAGASVAPAGDVNGDGVPDLLIGASTAAAGGTYRGAVFVVFGHSSGEAWSSTLSLASLDGSNGFRLDGVADHDYTGTSVSTAGDINGDGADDILIGAYAADNNGSGSGSVYVVFGHSSGAAWSSTVALNSLDGNNGFRVDGASGANFGFSMAALGDFNGDGHDDILVSAPWATIATADSYEGAAYVIFGQSSGASWSSSFSVTSLNGSNGFRLAGPAAHGYVGGAVSVVGDVNGDGRTDLAVAAPIGGGDYYGVVYVVFGQSSGFSWSSSVDLGSLNGSNGFALRGNKDNLSPGKAVSAVGDVNDDGIPDILIGAPSAKVGEATVGTAYVVYGRSSGNPWPATLSLGSLTSATGFRMEGEVDDAGTGSAVTGLGDINGDGIPDILVGAYRTNGFAGTAYVIFGGQQ
ncbi:MAG TPA: integrin alpha [bacterium]